MVPDESLTYFFAYTIWIVKNYFVRALFVLPLFWLWRYRSFRTPLAWLVVWIIVCEIATFIMMQMGVNKLAPGVFYPPVALALFTAAIVPLIRNASLKRIVRFWGYFITGVLVVYIMFFFGLDNLLTKQDTLTYPIMVPAVISMLLLLEIDWLIRPAENSISGLQLFFRGWIIYFCLGYVVWGARVFRYLHVGSDIALEYYIAVESLMFLAYLTWVVMLFQAMKYNLPEEWMKATRS